MPVSKLTIEERFWSYVNKTETCWLWIGALHDWGYGIFYVNRDRRLVRAHRYSLELAGIKVPGMKNVCHKCDVPECVNPGHLFIGTQQENIHDCMAKGRKAKVVSVGIKNGNCRLTENQVVEIKRLIEAGELQETIAKMFGIHQVMVSRIKCGKAWTHI